MTKDKHGKIAPRQHDGPYISKEERQHINQSFNTIIARPSSSSGDDSQTRDLRDKLKEKSKHIDGSLATSTDQQAKNVHWKLGMNDKNTTVSQLNTFNLCQKIGTKIQGDGLSHLNATNLRRKPA